MRCMVRTMVCRGLRSWGCVQIRLEVARGIHEDEGEGEGEDEDEDEEAMEHAQYCLLTAYSDAKRALGLDTSKTEAHSIQVQCRASKCRASALSVW